MKALVLGLLVSGLVAAAGCGKRDRSAGAPLVLADAKLIVEQADGATHIFSLKADGAVTFDTEPVVTVRKDGQIAAGGKLMARLNKDYKIIAHGVETNAAVMPSGVFQLDGADELLIAEDGKVTGPLLETMDHPRLNVEGAKVVYEGPPAARQAMLVGFAAFVTGLGAVPKPQ
jgi:hypothetical protein